MSRDKEPFDDGEVAAIEARVFALLAADAQGQEDPPSAAHHQLFIWRDHQQMRGRAEALTVLSQTLEAALAGRTDEVADRYREALEWFDRDGGRYDHDLEQAVLQVGNRIHAAQAEEQAATDSDEPTADTDCQTCQGRGLITSPGWADWHDRYEAARMASLDEHDDDYDFDASPEAWDLVGEPPEDEPEMIACRHCDGSGRIGDPSTGAYAIAAPAESPAGRYADHPESRTPNERGEVSTDTDLVQADFDADEFEDTLNGLLTEADPDARADVQRKLRAYRNHNQLLGMSDGMAHMSFALRAALEGDRGETAQHFAHARLMFDDADGPHHYPQLDQPTEDIYALLGDAAPDPATTGETDLDDRSALEAESVAAETPDRGHRDDEPTTTASPVDQAQRAVLELRGRRALEEQYRQTRDRADDEPADRRSASAADVEGVDEQAHVLSVYD